jgi:3-hydroxymyristoyl/3-hydroxydecanoyl-(acyl carrier protein) dehydratase
VSEGEADASGRQRFAMGDRVELGPEGRFQLLGRVDRSVKIGGLRLSLPAMERALESHPFVREAALVARTRGSDQRVMAALVLSDAGRAALRREGRRACGRALSKHLGAGFDPILLPRSWRYLDELPRNAQGKLPREAALLLFSDDDADDADVPTPEEGPTRLRRRMAVPGDLACLEGHFPAHPIVPGVAQIGWVLEAAGELLGAEPRVRALEALKFPTPLRPGDSLELEVELAAAADVLRFTLRDGARIFATGRCRLDPADAGPP